MIESNVSFVLDISKMKELFVNLFFLGVSLSIRFRPLSIIDLFISLKVVVINH